MKDLKKIMKSSRSLWRIKFCRSFCWKKKRIRIQWCRTWGVETHPQKLWFLKSLGKMSKNWSKKLWNSLTVFL